MKQIIIFFFISFIFFVIGVVLYTGTFIDKKLKKNANYRYVATALILLPLYSFNIFYYNTPAIYNKVVYLCIIVFTIVATGILIYYDVQSKCQCDPDENCINGKCVQIDSEVNPQSGPTPTDVHGRAYVKCGEIDCYEPSVCTQAEISTEGDLADKSVCCESDRIIAGTNGPTCCGGGQIANDAKSACVSPCGDGITCEEGQVCVTVKRDPSEESPTNFQNRVNKLASSNKKTVGDDSAQVCMKKSDCKFDEAGRYPAESGWYYQDQGNSDCLSNTDFDACKKSSPIYYSGAKGGQNFSAYLNYDVSGTCPNIDEACLKLGLDMVGATQVASNNGKCTMLLSGLNSNKFMNKSLTTSDRAGCKELGFDSKEICKPDGSVVTPPNKYCTCCDPTNQKMQCTTIGDDESNYLGFYSKCNDDTNCQDSDVKGDGCDPTKDCADANQGFWYAEKSVDDIQRKINTFSCNPGLAILNAVSLENNNIDGYNKCKDGWCFNMQAFCCDRNAVRAYVNRDDTKMQNLIGAGGARNSDDRKQFIKKHCGNPKGWKFSPIMGQNNNKHCMKSKWTDYDYGRHHCEGPFITKITQINKSNFGI